MEAVLPMKKKRELPKWLYPVYYHRKGIAIGLIVFALLFACIAFCANPPSDPSALSGLPKLIHTMLTVIFDGSGSDEAIKLLKISASTGNMTVAGYNLSGVGSFVSSLGSIFQNTGMCLLILFWGMSYFDMLMQANNQVILEQLVKKFIYLAFGIILVTKGQDIVFGLINLGTTVVDKVVATAPSATTNAAFTALWTDIYKDITTAEDVTGNFFKTIGPWFHDVTSSLGYIMQLFVPWIICWICSLLVEVACWTRFIEACLLAIVSPVMFSDVGTQNQFMHSGAARAIKNVAALALQGGIILISLKLCGVISAAVANGIMNPAGGGAVGFDDFMKLAFELTLIGIVKIGTISKATTVAKQSLGLA